MPFHIPLATGNGGGVVHYNQAFAGTSTVTVSHGLGYPPDVNIQNTTGNKIVGLIVHTTVNAFTVSFNVPLAGTVYYT